MGADGDRDLRRPALHVRRPLPIDRLLWSFDDLIQTLLATLHDLSGDDLQAFFSGCAPSSFPE